MRNNIKTLMSLFIALLLLVSAISYATYAQVKKEPPKKEKDELPNRGTSGSYTFTCSGPDECDMCNCEIKITCTVRSTNVGAGSCSRHAGSPYSNNAISSAKAEAKSLAEARCKANIPEDACKLPTSEKGRVCVKESLNEEGKGGCQNTVSGKSHTFWGSFTCGVSCEEYVVLLPQPLS